jgi:hypothetical protein
MKKILTKGVVLVLFIFVFSLFPIKDGVMAAGEVRQIYFPTDKTLKFTDDFGEARSGHLHEGIDIMGPKMTPLYSAIDGKVKHVFIPEPSWGYEITLEDADGYTYNYIHINNDTPGTDDGLGGVDNAYAPFIYDGAPVQKGQQIGWMGDSGNAESVGSHLHFEIREPDGTAIDPYLSLIAARDGTSAAAVSSSGATSQTASAPKAVAPKFVFKKDLKVGMTDSDVKQLQKFLNTHGYKVAKTGPGSPGKETDYFGSATKAALIKFQKANKIYPASGRFGPLTRAAVNKKN